MMGEPPIISIITVVFNGIKTIEQTIKSVLQQTYKNIEYIIVDGGSTDGTIELVKQYEFFFAQKNIRYKFISERDKGIYDAMNKGITLAKGSWIGIVNSDDFYEKETIQHIADFIDSNPDAELIYGDLNFINDFGQIKLEKPKQDLNLLSNVMTVFHPAIFVKKEVYEKYGLFNLGYKLCADWDIILRFYTEKVKFYYIERTLSNFRSGGAGSGFGLIHLKERYRIRHNYKNKRTLWFDLKDIIIFIYFRIYYKKTTMG